MSTKDPLLIGNWKMHKTSKEAAAFVKEFNKKIKRIEYFNLAVCVPSTALDALSRVFNIIFQDSKKRFSQLLFR